MLAGLEAHGRAWDLVAKVVGTRTRAQTRAHAEKTDKRAAAAAATPAFGGHALLP